jgi:hypothetical protein
MNYILLDPFGGTSRCHLQNLRNNWSSSVDIVTRLGMDDQEIADRFPAGPGDCSQTDSRDYPHSYAIRTEGSFAWA